MLHRTKALLLILIFVLSAPLFISELYANNPYKEIAEELSQAVNRLKNPKVAIIPFSYVGTGDKNAGTIIAERITTYIVNIGMLEVVERTQIEKILTELNFQSTGTVDSQTAKKIGRVLGVEGIITGSLIPKKGGKVEINARVISTETAKVLRAAYTEVEKDWEDGTPVQTYKPAPSTGTSIESKKGTSVQTASQTPVQSQNIRFYLDIFGGISFNSMDLRFSRTGSYMDKSEFNIEDALFADNFSSISWKKLNTKGNLLAGIRFGSIMKKLLLNIEVSYLYYSVTRQSKIIYRNNVSTGTYQLPGGYFSVNSIFATIGAGMHLPIHRRIAFYFCIGGGLSLNKWEGPTIRGYTISTSDFTNPVSGLNIGFTFNLPIGMKVYITDIFGILLEGKLFYNRFKFTRNISNETDRVTLRALQIIVGVFVTWGK